LEAGAVAVGAEGGLVGAAAGAGGAEAVVPAGAVEGLVGAGEVGVGQVALCAGVAVDAAAEVFALAAE
jgi:hypothetical protein